MNYGYTTLPKKKFGKINQFFSNTVTWPTIFLTTLIQGSKKYSSSFSTEHLWWLWVESFFVISKTIKKGSYIQYILRKFRAIFVFWRLSGQKCGWIRFLWFRKKKDKKGKLWYFYFMKLYMNWWKFIYWKTLLKVSQYRTFLRQFW